MARPLESGSNRDQTQGDTIATRTRHHTHYLYIGSSEYRQDTNMHCTERITPSLFHQRAVCTCHPCMYSNCVTVYHHRLAQLHQRLGLLVGVLQRRNAFVLATVAQCMQQRLTLRRRQWFSRRQQLHSCERGQISEPHGAPGNKLLPNTPNFPA